MKGKKRSSEQISQQPSKKLSLGKTTISNQPKPVLEDEGIVYFDPASTCNVPASAASPHPFGAASASSSDPPSKLKRPLNSVGFAPSDLGPKRKRDRSTSKSKSQSPTVQDDEAGYIKKTKEFNRRASKEKGLFNKLNWCYMNSVLQAMRLTMHDFLEDLENMQMHLNQKELAKLMKIDIYTKTVDFFKQLDENDRAGKLTYPTELRDIILSRLTRFDNDEQHDPDEFFGAYMQVLFEEIYEAIPNPPKMSNWKPHRGTKQPYECPLEKHFRIVVREQTICCDPNCKNKKKKGSKERPWSSKNNDIKENLLRMTFEPDLGDDEKVEFAKRLKKDLCEADVEYKCESCNKNTR